MRPARFIILAAVSSALSLIALAGISLPELNGFEAVNYTVGTNPASVAVGDFNSDGKNDIAVANSDSNNISILLGNGDGSFQAAMNYPGLCFGPIAIATGDFNNDGKLDLAVPDARCGSGNIFRGNGNGTFQAATAFQAGNCAQSVTIGDFNNDGNLDLALANGGICPASPTKEGLNAPTLLLPNSVGIVLGNGNGSFRLMVSCTPPAYFLPMSR